MVPFQSSMQNRGKELQQCQRTVRKVCLRDRDDLFSQEDEMSIVEEEVSISNVCAQMRLQGSRTAQRLLKFDSIADALVSNPKEFRISRPQVEMPQCRCMGMDINASHRRR